MLFATLAILFYGMVLTKLLIQRAARATDQVIVPIILRAVHDRRSFAIAGRLFDVWVMLAFGILGFASCGRCNYPMAPLVLGIVLGDLLEKSLRRGLVLSDGSLAPFFTRPISLVIWVGIALIIALRFEAVRSMLRRLRPGPARAPIASKE